MSHDPVDRHIAERARALFDRASIGIDATTAARLQRARRDALRPRAAATAWPRWLPAGAAAALAIAIAFAWRMPPAAPTPAPDVVADAPVDAGPSAAAPGEADEIERLLEAEDPDLYAWLAEAPVATTAATP